MYISAVIILVNAFCDMSKEWRFWTIVLNVNTFILISISLMLVLVSWLNYSARGNKLAGCIDDAYGTCLALEPPSKGYYDNEKVKDKDLRFILNVYESCFFSVHILRKQTGSIIFKNLIIVVTVLLAIAFGQSSVAITILGLFIVVHYMRRMWVTIIVRRSLAEICNTFQTLLNNYKQGNTLDLKALLLNVSNYETAMVWLGTVLSKRVYTKYNKQLTQEWKEKQVSLLRDEDFEE